jgi:hypothetical protein
MKLSMKHLIGSALALSIAALTATTVNAATFGAPSTGGTEVTGTTDDDGSGTDFYISVCLDANGNIEDIDDGDVTVGFTTISDSCDAGDFDGNDGPFPLSVVMCDTPVYFPYSDDDPAAAGFIAAYCGGGSSDAPVFSGPPLPGPDARNLVLLLSDTAVFSAPGGSPTGRVMTACQTGFVLELSDDGAYARIYSMGGWIPVSTYTDVAEDYGQPGGAPIYPLCVGR